MQFNWEEEAQREQILLRAALVGANGSGKTLGALRIATYFATPDNKVAVIDTEKGRAKQFADRFKFAHLQINPLEATPELMLAAARDAADKVGLGGVVVIDSISHEWIEVLTEADRFADWKDLTPRHRDFIEGITSLPAHLVVTMRAKVKYSVEEMDVPGQNRTRQVITRLGVGPVQREGVEYEFDVLAYLDSDHLAHFTNRCDSLVGQVREINDDTIALMKEWCDEGIKPTPRRIIAMSDLPVPRSWAALKDAVSAYSEETWEDFRWFLAQASDHLYGTGNQSKLTKPQKNTLFQKAAAVTIKLLENHDPNEFPPPARLEFQAAWALLLDGEQLPGPDWAMSPEEVAEGREPRVPGGQPPPGEGSGEEEGESTTPATDSGAVSPPPDSNTSPSPEQAFTDGPLTDQEQATLDAVREEFGEPAEVEGEATAPNPEGASAPEA